MAASGGLLHLVGELAHYVIRRIVTRVRASGHGGMLAFVPTANIARYAGPEATLRPKYAVRLPDAATPLHQTLLLAILARLSDLGELTWEASSKPMMRTS